MCLALYKQRGRAAPIPKDSWSEQPRGQEGIQLTSREFWTAAVPPVIAFQGRPGKGWGKKEEGRGSNEGKCWLACVQAQIPVVRQGRGEAEVWLETEEGSEAMRLRELSAMALGLPQGQSNAQILLLQSQVAEKSLSLGS